MSEEFYCFNVEAEDAGKRLDRFLAEKPQMPSRSYLQKLIEDSRVTVGKKAAKSNYRLQAGDIVELSIPEPRQLEAEAEVNRPKALFADSVSSSSDTILVREMAKILRQNGVKVGQNRLYQWLRENGYLIRQRGDDYNMPTQYSLEHGLMTVKESTFTPADGEPKIWRTAKITGKGQLYFVNKFLVQ